LAQAGHSPAFLPRKSLVQFVNSNVMQPTLFYACCIATAFIANAARLLQPPVALFALTQLQSSDDDRRYHENGLAPRVPKSAETESDNVGADSNDELDGNSHGSNRHGTSRMEGEEAEHNIATGLAIMFLGMVFMVGFLFFMLAYPDDQVRHYSVRIVSSTVIIFMAIAIEYAALLSHCVAKLTWLERWLEEPNLAILLLLEPDNPCLLQGKTLTPQYGCSKECAFSCVSFRGHLLLL